MYRWNSRGNNNNTNSSSRSNLSEFSVTTVISARGWISNVFKRFLSLFSIFQFRRVIRKVNPINYCTCLFSALSISTYSLSFPCFPCCFTSITNNSPDSNSTAAGCCSSSCSSTKSSLQINNCNIPGSKDKPRLAGKMAQILSKTMTLLGVAFVIHFIIMSTFAEREEFVHGYNSPAVGGSRHHSIRRQQRSYRNEKHTQSPEENTLAPPRFPNKTEALFFTENSTIVTAQIGSKTYLPCAVRNLGSGVASWIRRGKGDYTLLTVGMGTYSNDDRFVVSHNRAAQSWELHIKFVKETDLGVYECQISTHPPSSIFIHLSVVEAKAEILGEPDKHVRSGSTFELVCVLRDSTEPPVYVFWYHNDRMINYDNVRGVVVNSDTEKSILTIQDAQKTDSGNYSCVPSNARPTSISVHILNGEKPAAMQHGSRSHSGKEVGSSLCLLFVTTFAVFILTSWLVTTNLGQNWFILCQEDAPPSSKKAIEVNGRKDDETVTDATETANNLQIVRLHPVVENIVSSVQWSSIHKELERLLVEDEKGACPDNDDKIRFEKRPEEEESLLKENLSSSLSDSRYCMLEISCQQHHDSIQHQQTGKNSLSAKILHGFLTFSSSNSFFPSKNVADADVYVVDADVNSSSSLETTRRSSSTITNSNLSSMISHFPSESSSHDLSLESTFRKVESTSPPSLSPTDSLVPLIFTLADFLHFFMKNTFSLSFLQSSSSLSSSTEGIKRVISR